MVLATTEFEDLARESARHEGVAHARIVSVQHPIGGEAETALFEKADTALEALLSLGQGSR